jgi:hypothetical protein
MAKSPYFLSHYMRCGEMPLFLLFYSDKRGNGGHCMMLCTYRKLRLLLRQRKGFSNPEKYGHVIYTSRGKEPNDMLKEMLKSRYGFDLSQYEANIVPLA